MSDLYIGLMSGTSGDGLDAVLVDFENHLNIIATHYHPYPLALREQIFALCKPGENEIQRLGELDNILGHLFAESVKTLLVKANINAEQIKAIGSHGQNVRHNPRGQYPFTLQISDPNIIAAETGITTIADFRRKDIALSGQGAPLVPAFHQHIFSSPTEDRVIVNIGGIANITFLPKTRNKLIGFDTGPGNALLDGWIHHHQGVWQDKDGAWAASGKVDEALLKRLLEDPYFQLRAPKSTGREYFNLTWLQQYLSPSFAPEDVQATLIELTAQSIMRAIKPLTARATILICGGGTHNTQLLSALKKACPPSYTITLTDSYGLPVDWVEAVAFAWLARQTNLKQSGNAPDVTGAKRAAILGGIYYA